MSTVLITGGYGSFGTALARHLLAANPTDKIRLLGRSESGLSNLRTLLGPSPRLTYILADIRDLDRLTSSFEGVDFVYHAAALKRVPEGKLYTSEFVKTNVAGTLNVNTAAGRCGVKKVLLIGTDKCCEPINEYGITKALAEKITIESNMVWHNTHFASVRGGNIWGSRGSVMEIWSKADKEISVYGNCVRFHLSMNKWLRFCGLAMDNMRGGEVFIPKCRTWNLLDLADAYALLRGLTVSQEDPRDGDKDVELLVSRHESSNTIDLGWAYVIEPGATIQSQWNYIGHQGSRVDWKQYDSSMIPESRNLNVRELQVAIDKDGETE